MNFWTWMVEGVKRLDVLDISLIKLSVMAATLLLAKWWPPLLSLDWYWYAGIFVIAAVRPWMAMFR